MDMNSINKDSTIKTQPTTSSKPGATLAEREVPKVHSEGRPSIPVSVDQLKKEAETTKKLVDLENARTLASPEFKKSVDDAVAGALKATPRKYGGPLDAKENAQNMLRTILESPEFKKNFEDALAKTLKTI